ncbi:MAG TPA: Ig-like domain-containing protein [Terriglobales bacterium]|nr:Ig-like domain-containing protein [Terriglobales bacterium]
MARLRLLIALLLFALLLGCGSSSSSLKTRTLQSLLITPAKPSVALGNQQQFKATGTYSDGTSQDLTSTATWASSQPSVAAINATGLATTKAPGMSTIMATSSSVSGSTTLTVTPAALVSIAVSPPNPSIAAGNTQQFIATGTFSDSSTQDLTDSVSWSASAASVASITAGGLAKGVSVGTATITATSGSISGSASLTVTNAVLVSIALSPVAPSVPLGLLQQFSATGTLSDGSTQDLTRSVTWASADSTIASIASGGLATARNLGETKISASSGTIQESTTLTVSAASLRSVTLGEPVTIAKNTSHLFVAIGTFDDGSTRDISTNVTWSSSDPSVATIPPNFRVARGIHAGTTRITATLNSVSASANLTVTNATVLSISITPANRHVPAGIKFSYLATGLFNDGSSQDLGRDVVWGSSAPAVASIAYPGLAQSLSSGTSTISAAFGGVPYSTFLIVSSATLTSISVKPSNALIAPGSFQGFSAIGTFSDTTSESVTNVATWTSSDSAVASVNSLGQVIGETAGNVAITAALDHISDSAAVVVQSSPLQSITITPAVASVPVGIAIPLTATATFGDGTTQKLTNSVTWTCSPSSVATVSDAPGSQGSVTGIAPGSATITAVFAGIVGTSTVNTTNATLTSITVSPKNPDVALGTGQQFSATGHFSDGSTLSLTNQVTWSSSSVGIAVISSLGLANSVAPGSATITAALYGVSGTALLTVH